ncbi:JAB domain-containing protein [uncultured Sphingomonas sp.]|uniref:JAB domain-containing protein n=1 Tax=uncultured Sphingomonas sp. TaxID=158754 RepID=UPI0025FCCA83|nr:JAB domain-containing protein [uncultured Sphingomonas sp.]
MAFLLDLRAFVEAALRTDAFAEPVVSTAESLLGYMRVKLSGSSIEEVHCLYLNASNHLLRDEVVSRGSVFEAPLAIYSILRRALELNATALIIAHNHPSGDPLPSTADIRGTRHLAAAAKTIGITLHDHLIVGHRGWVSMRRRGYL